MQFLRTLFWVLIGALVVLFARSNWRDVPLMLWANLTLDINLPLLLLIMFLVGFLPTWLIMRGKLWRLKRRPGPDEGKPVPAAPPAPTAPPAEDGL